VENSTNKICITFTMVVRFSLTILVVLVLLLQLSGCLSDDAADNAVITAYQQAVVEKGPQRRITRTGLDFLRPATEPNIPALEVTMDETSGKNLINFTLEDAVVRALASSPEISIVSFDPAIAREDITKAVSMFDITTFGKLNSEKNDNPTDSIFQSGQSTSRLWEVGIKQRGVTGAEWSLSYALARNWDDLSYRALPTRYEPMLAFQIKQPLLRDGGKELNLAGINISHLNHRIALAAFRKKTEDVATEVISLYWILLQARRDLEIQQSLLDKTLETLTKVENRRDIDATNVQIKQAESFAKSRHATLLQAQKRIIDVQDALVRLLSDHQLNLLNDLDLVPVTTPTNTPTQFEQNEVLKLAMANNAEIKQAQIGVEVAQINVDVAQRQKMPRLDLVASARMQGMSSTQSDAHDNLEDADYTSVAIGLTFEFPYGNRQRKAEFRRRKLERSKAVSVLQNISDQVAAQAKERIRLARTAFKELQIQKDAAEAASIHLQALEDTETVREKLTPEFLLVKLQAQETVANAQRAEIKAIVDYNIALTRLAQTTGTVLDLRYVQTALPTTGG
jgi:outer membrane protein TolC